MIHVGKPVTGKFFLGRDDEVNVLTQYLRMGQNVTIIAPRRYGKTSLVLQALRQLKKEGHYTAFIDVFGNPTLLSLAGEITSEVLDNHGLRRSFSRLQKSVKELAKNIELKTTIDQFSYVLGFAQGADEDPWSLFSDSLDFVDEFASFHGKRVICAFDEFGEIRKFDREQEIIKLVRSKIQLHQNSTYMFSGSYESVMQSMFVSRKSPFYRMTHILRLGPLEHRVLAKYFARKTKELGIPANREQIDLYLDIAKGHPYYSQLTLQQLLLFHIQRKRIPTPAELLDEILAVEKDYLEKNWEEFASNKEYVFILRHLASNPKGVYGKASKKKINASRALGKLEGMGVIYKDEQGYHYYDPIFQLWVGRKIGSH